MICVSLQQVANISSIVTAIGALVGSVAYLRSRWKFHQKSDAFEQFLLSEKLKQRGKGQHSIPRIISEIGLTEDEILQISFANPKIRRVVTVDDVSNLARELLFEYDPKGKSK